MALVNPNIAMGVRPFELNYQPRNALTDYAQVIQIQNAQREQATRNALNEGYQAAYDPVTQTVDQNKLMTFMANKGYGSQIPGIQKGILEARTAQVGYDKAQQELAAARMKEARNLLPNVTTPEAYAQWREYAAKQMPGIAAMLPQQYSPEGVQRLMVEADKWLELNKPTTQVINRSGQTDVVRVPGAYDTTGAPTTLGTYADVPLPAAVEAQKSRIAKDGAARTIVKLPEQEKAFETELGKGQANRILDSKIAAEDAAQILRTNQIGRDILASGAITGTGAEFFVGLNNALNQAGIDFGYADAAANSQAYAAALGGNVGKIIKQFGAGTGLSDADRKFAEQMAGGKITLSDKALKRILDINDRVANNIIDLHNRNVKNIRTNVPLTVEKPIASSRHPSEAVSQIPGVKSTSAQPAGRTIVRTGKFNGRKVIQYSDGSTEYVN